MQDVSVIMPAKNAEGTIERAVRSALVEPTVQEVIVINDASTDNTRGVLEAIGDPRIRIIDAQGAGCTGGINIGLEAAEGAFFARLDADDWWGRDRLTWQRDFLVGHPDFVGVCGGYRTVTEKGEHIADLVTGTEARDVTERMKRGDGVTHLCTYLITMEAIRQLGGARPWFFSAQDMDIQYRLAELGRIWYDPTRICLNYVLHDKSVTHTLGTKRREFFGGSAKLFAKQRQDRADGQDDLMRGTPPEFDPALAPVPARSARDHICDQLTGAAWRSFDGGDVQTAFRKLAMAMRYAPMRGSLWRNMAALIYKSLRRRSPS